MKTSTVNVNTHLIDSAIMRFWYDFFINNAVLWRHIYTTFSAVVVETIVHCVLKNIPAVFDCNLKINY